MPPKARSKPSLRELFARKNFPFLFILGLSCVALLSFMRWEIFPQGFVTDDPRTSELTARSLLVEGLIKTDSVATNGGVSGGIHQQQQGNGFSQHGLRLLLASHGRLFWYYPETNQSVVLHEGEGVHYGTFPGNFNLVTGNLLNLWNVVHIGDRVFICNTGEGQIVELRYPDMSPMRTLPLFSLKEHINTLSPVGQDGDELMVMLHNLGKSDVVRLNMSTEYSGASSQPTSNRIKHVGEKSHGLVQWGGWLILLDSQNGALVGIPDVGNVHGQAAPQEFWKVPEGGKFLKGLAVVDDVAYFGISVWSKRSARDDEDADSELGAVNLLTKKLVFRRKVPSHGLLNIVAAPHLGEASTYRAMHSRDDSQISDGVDTSASSVISKDSQKPERGIHGRGRGKGKHGRGRGKGKANEGGGGKWLEVAEGKGYTESFHDEAWTPAKAMELYERNGVMDIVTMLTAEVGRGGGGGEEGEGMEVVEATELYERNGMMDIETMLTAEVCRGGGGGEEGEGMEVVEATELYERNSVMDIETMLTAEVGRGGGGGEEGEGMEVVEATELYERNGVMDIETVFTAKVDRGGEGEGMEVVEGKELYGRNGVMDNVTMLTAEGFLPTIWWLQVWDSCRPFGGSRSGGTWSSGLPRMSIHGKNSKTPWVTGLQMPLRRIDITDLKEAVRNIPAKMWDPEEAARTNAALEGRSKNMNEFKPGCGDDIMDRIVRLQLTSMPAGKMILPHRDHGGYSHLSHRIHIPILTDDGVNFMICGTEEKNKGQRKAKSAMEANASDPWKPFQNCTAINMEEGVVSENAQSFPFCPDVDALPCPDLDGANCHHLW
eukprot:gene3608-13692_t